MQRVPEKLGGLKGYESIKMRLYKEVLYETTQVEVYCICSLFNFKGYLCRHAFNVLNYNGVEDIPSQYILPRWDKDYKRKIPVDSVLSHVDVNNPVELYDHLHKRIIRGAI